MPLELRAEGDALGQQQVVGDQDRAVLHLEEDVPETAHVVVQQVAGDLGALGHPVEPDAGDVAAAVDVVVADDDVDRAVELDAGHFRAAEELVDMDVVDLVAGDRAEGAADAADDAGLLAVVDVVVADEVAADGRLVPAVGQRAADAGGVGIGAAGVVGVVGTRRRICPGRRRSTSSSGSSLFSMIQPLLQLVPMTSPICSADGGAQLRGGVAQGEAAHGDVVDAGLAPE